MPKTALNRTFNVGDRVCIKPTNTTIRCANTPKQKPTRRGVVVELTTERTLSTKSKSGYSNDPACVVKFDGSQNTEVRRQARLIHESELETFLQSR